MIYKSYNTFFESNSLRKLFYNNSYFIIAFAIYDFLFARCIFIINKY